MKEFKYLFLQMQHQKISSNFIIMKVIIDHLVRETNLYAQQFIAKEDDNLRPHSLAMNWK